MPVLKDFDKDNTGSLVFLFTMPVLKDFFFLCYELFWINNNVFSCKARGLSPPPAQDL